MAEVIAYYDPGADITAHASVGLTGGRCVAITANRRAGGPAGVDDSSDGLVVVGLPAADGRIFGVASHDAASGSKVNIMRGPKVVPVEMGVAGPIAAFAEVNTGADGRLKAAAATTPPIGFLLTAAATAGTYGQVALYNSGAIA